MSENVYDLDSVPREALVAPCPFCAETKSLRLVYDASADAIPDQFMVICDATKGGCGGSGGYRVGGHAACNVWNERALSEAATTFETKLIFDQAEPDPLS